MPFRFGAATLKLAQQAFVRLRLEGANRHHYVDGMQGASPQEIEAFAGTHPDLYRHERQSLRLRIDKGSLAIGSLAAVGFASGALPDVATMRPMRRPVGGAAGAKTIG